MRKPLGAGTKRGATVPRTALATASAARVDTSPFTGKSQEQSMVNREDIEAFLDRLGAHGASHKEVEPGLWVVRPSGSLDFDVVVTHNPPVVLLRVKVMPLPERSADVASLTRRLLELNATDLLHGSYGIDHNDVVLTEALELAHLDYEEFLAAFESMTLSLTTHLRELAAFREGR
jgi:hypothetical protein